MSDALEEIRQEHESWLSELEGLAVKAIASGNWEAVYTHIASLENTTDDIKASADELDTPSADPNQTTDINES